MEFGVIGNDVPIQVIAQLFSGFRFRIEEQAVPQIVNVRVGENASLGGEEERVKPVLRLQILDVICAHSVQQARAVFACYADLATSG